MNNPFVFPYRGRILAALPGHAEIELFRTRRQLLDSDIKSFTRNLDPAWEVWCEEQTDQRTLISERQQIKQHPGRALGSKYAKKEKA